MTVRTTLDDADRGAITRLQAVRPVWRGVSLARDEFDFPPRTILHAGPPFRSTGLPAPVANSAVMGILYEGWAETEEDAKGLLASGGIRLAPAQDHAAMVPLAAVLSPNMSVSVVADANDPANRAYAPLNGGPMSAQRLGLAGPQILAHLSWINGNLAATLRIIVDRDVDLIEIADAALASGDDGHGRTMAASRLLVEALAPRLGSDTLERRWLDRAPGFFLNIWMAATKCMAAAAVVPGSSVVTAMGANGLEVGLQVGGLPDLWLTAPADPPAGPLEPGFGDHDRLGAIGDSALVDGLGFGAMLDGGGLMPVQHPAFRRHPVRVGLPARGVAEAGLAPTIALGILDRTGRGGRIGGGHYRPPVAPFAEACRLLAGPDQPRTDLNEMECPT